ncbi:hypothetical protein, partial [Flavonifractor plautii]
LNNSFPIDFCTPFVDFLVQLLGCSSQPRPLTPGIFYLILRMPLGRFYLGVISWYHQKED